MRGANAKLASKADERRVAATASRERNEQIVDHARAAAAPSVAKALRAHEEISRLRWEADHRDYEIAAAKAIAQRRWGITARSVTVAESLAAMAKAANVAKSVEANADASAVKGVALAEQQSTPD